MRRLVIVAVVAGASLLSTALPAAAATPSQSADATWMFDARVRAVQVVGQITWVGGAFDHYLRPDRSVASAAPGIAALDGSGSPANVNLPALGGSGRKVEDLELGPDGNLYVAGKFTYQFGGKSRQNLVAIDPQTGSIQRGFNTPSLNAVAATSSHVYAGGRYLDAYFLNGGKDSGFRRVTPSINDSLRGHSTSPQIRDILITGGDLIAIGQFDFINGSGQKVAVRVDEDTGAVRSWKLANITQSSAAFGIKGLIQGTALVVAAGGSDFVASYGVSNGAQNWKTDTSGSSQAVAMFDSSTLIVGGHFQWIANGPNQQCGSNSSPNTSCLNIERLAALQFGNGSVIQSWTPQICCKYNGVWALDVGGGRLHVGGEFTRAGGRIQQYYARFS